MIALSARDEGAGMRITIGRGQHPLALDVEAARLVAEHHGPAPLADPAEAVRRALEAPHGFPPLRRALTPGDRVVVVVDESLPQLAAVLPAVLQHVRSAGVEAETITLLGAAGSSQTWLDHLPDDFDDVRVEEHDPRDRRKLAYLATTQAGRRLYLNRTLVDADQVVVLTGRRYDPVLGHGGGESDLFPALSDEATRAQLAAPTGPDLPAEDSPVRREAVEVTWLLGMPFFVQGIPSAGDGLARVVAGTGEATQEAQRLLDENWLRRVPRRADAVVVSLSGDPSRQHFADLAAAVTCAGRVVQPGGRIIVLSEAAPELGPGAEVILGADDPQAALAVLEKADRPGTGPAIRWARGAAQARVSLWSGLAPGTVEDLFATPLRDAAEVNRLLAQAEAVLVLEDAHRMVAVVE